MEERLAKQIRSWRSCGYPVETWMVVMEAKILFHDIFPNGFLEPKFDQIDEDDSFAFKGSRGWLDNFFKWFGFNRRTIGKKMNKKGGEAELLKTTAVFHTELRALQLSETNDPTYGMTSPHYVYSHDQVPIKLCNKAEKTINTKGVTEVYDATTSSFDCKRFCTLNLFVPMEPRDDGLNY